MGRYLPPLSEVGDIALNMDLLVLHSGLFLEHDTRMPNQELGLKI